MTSVQLAALAPAPAAAAAGGQSSGSSEIGHTQQGTKERSVAPAPPTVFSTPPAPEGIPEAEPTFMQAPSPRAGSKRPPSPHQTADRQPKRAKQRVPVVANEENMDMSEEEEEVRKVSNPHTLELHVQTG